MCSVPCLTSPLLTGSSCRHLPSVRRVRDPGCARARVRSTHGLAVSWLPLDVLFPSAMLPLPFSLLLTGVFVPVLQSKRPPPSKVGAEEILLQGVEWRASSSCCGPGCQQSDVIWGPQRPLSSPCHGVNHFPSRIKSCGEVPYDHVEEPPRKSA